MKLVLDLHIHLRNALHRRTGVSRSSITAHTARASVGALREVFGDKSINGGLCVASMLPKPQPI